MAKSVGKNINPNNGTFFILPTYIMTCNVPRILELHLHHWLQKGEDWDVLLPLLDHARPEDGVEDIAVAVDYESLH